ncbi:MAG: hypothetical protein ACEQSX_08220 [Baekduiaceae bacterium]
MDYTTDTTPIVEGFLKEQRDASRTVALDTVLEARAIRFCADLRVLDGKDADPELIARTAKNAEAYDEAVLRRDRFAGKLPAPKTEPTGPDPFDVARRDDLAGRVGRLEAEHAAHDKLRELNDEAGFDAEAEKHAAEMLQLDGFWSATRAELQALSEKLPDPEPVDAVEEKPAATSRTGRKTKG